jgi:hypothetical protein
MAIFIPKKINGSDSKAQNRVRSPSFLSQKRPDTVGQPPSTEIGVLNMPSWKAKKLGKLPREKVLLEL